MTIHEEKSMRPCKYCGVPTEHITLVTSKGTRVFDGAPDICEACVKLEQEKEKEKEVQQRQADLQAKWERVCPPLYRDTDLRHASLSRKLWGSLKGWEPNGVMGLGVIGETGRGKTRLCFARLRDLHFAGYHVMASSAKRIEKAVQDSFSDDKIEKRDSRAFLNAIADCEVLFLDDIGKEKYTERVASDFYALIETRTSNLLPTIWTANTSATELTRRMGSEHGDATVRRLMEFSDIVTV